METSRVKIHLNRGGQSLGQFTPEELRAGFRDGKFAGTDLAWRDGMPMWKPLSEVIDELAPDASAGSESAAPAVAQDDGRAGARRRAQRGAVGGREHAVFLQGKEFAPRETECKGARRNPGPG